MFTGLVEEVGRIRSLRKRRGGLSICIEHRRWPTPAAKGESIAVQGVCLTVVSSQTESFTCDLLHETERQTTLGWAKPGQHVNLERALRIGDRVGGHFVTGHIDGQGTIEKIEQAGGDFVLKIRCPSHLTETLVLKGSIAVDGVSLTIAGLAGDVCVVHIIPHTWARTTLSRSEVGGRVNVEADILLKRAHGSRALLEDRILRSVTRDDLRRAGFDS